MPRDNNHITKADCEKNIIKFTKQMEELKDDLNSFKIDVIREISQLPDKLESKFAPKSVEKDIEDLKNKVEKRADKSEDHKWEIMTMAVMIVIGIILAALNLN